MSNQSTAQDSLKKLSSKLTELHKELPDMLPEQDNQVILSSTRAAFERLLNRINFLAGITNSTTMPQYEPIRLTGEEIPKPSHKPSQTEKEIFVEKVTRLYNQITTLSPDGILNDYTIDEEVLVLRGVAKKAGVENFEDADLTVEFIEAIQEAIKESESQDAEAKSLEEKLKAETEALQATGTLEPGGEEENGDDEEDDEFEDTGEEEDDFDFDEAIESLSTKTGNGSDAGLQKAIPAPGTQPVERKKPGPKPKLKVAE